MEKILKITLIALLGVFLSQELVLAQNNIKSKSFLTRKSCLSQHIVIDAADFRNIFLADETASFKPKNNINLVDFTLQVISNDERMRVKAQKYLKAGDLKKAIEAYHEIRNKTDGNKDLLEAIVELGFQEIDFYFQRAEFNEAKGFCLEIIRIDPWRELAYLYLGAIEMLEGNHMAAFQNFSFAKALSLDDPAFKLLSDMMEFVVIADKIVCDEKSIMGLLENIHGGRRILKLAESFELKKNQNNKTIERFVKDIYPVSIIFPVLAEEIDVLRRALGLIGVNVELEYPLENFMYKEALYVASSRGASKHDVLGQIVYFNVKPEDTAKNKFRVIQS